MDSLDQAGMVDAHYTNLYRFALSLARNPDDASDLTQQTFVVYARKGTDIRDPGKVKSWLFTTLYREFLKMRERGKRIVPMEDEMLENISESPRDDGTRQAEQSEMIQALQSLEEIHRSILTLHYLEDRPYKTVAEILAIPIGTVMSRLHRAKDALRNRLKNGPSVGIKAERKPSDTRL